MVLLAFLGACARVDYQPVDLQLDVLGALPDQAAMLHVCVEGAGEHTQGAGNGRGVFSGIPPGPAVVRFDVLDEADGVLASAGPATFDGVGYLTTPLLEGGEACLDDGAPVEAGAESQVLGFRVVEP
jgi:hypothetical protein